LSNAWRWATLKKAIGFMNVILRHIG